MDDLDALVPAAAAGDRRAVESVLAGVSDRVYALAMRMLADPTEAEDATQEILLRIAKGLAGFRGEARLSTWVYRIAANQLLTMRAQRAELRSTFESMASWLDDGLAAPAPEAPDPVLVEEAKLFCTHAMLSCLDRDHRLAYILGHIVEVTSDEGGEILDITPELFRQRLSRARRELEAFVHGRCGLVAAEHPCRCPRQIHNGIARGFVDANRLRFANHPVRTGTAQIGEFVSAAKLFRSLPEWAAPAGLVERIRGGLADLP